MVYKIKSGGKIAYVEADSMMAAINSAKTNGVAVPAVDGEYERLERTTILNKLEAEGDIHQVVVETGDKILVAAADWDKLLGEIARLPIIKLEKLAAKGVLLKKD